MTNLPRVSMPSTVIRPPKIASVHVARVPGANGAGAGFKVSHVMDRAPTQTFAFQDPKKMMLHLGRIQSSQWRNPDRNEAHSVTRDMDIGPTV